MSATATELAEKTPAQHRYHEANERHYSNREVEMAAGAFDRAEEVHAEHDRMILDLQGAVSDLAMGKLTPPQINDLQAELFRVIDHVKELQATIEDLIAGSGVVLDRAVNDAPVVTERFMHKQTAKGWRLDESSLTIDWKGNRPDPNTRSELLRNSFAGGTAEADERNRNPEPANVP